MKRRSSLSLNQKSKTIMNANEIKEFQANIRQGIPSVLPSPRQRDEAVSHAPRRKQILSPDEERLALKNALRYFPAHQHAELAPEFLDELHTYGRIYMYRLRPMLSRSRTVMALSSNVSKSTVTQNGVPISSSRR